MSKGLRTFILTIFLALSATTPLFASQITVNIPLDDPSYYLIEKLYASGLTSMPLYGERPWSRYYAAQLINEAIKNYESFEPEKGATNFRKFNRRFAQRRFVKVIIDKLKTDFAFELKQMADGKNHYDFHPIKNISLQYTYLNNSPSVVPWNPPDSIDAVFQAQTGNREGKQYTKGQNYFVETEHYAQLGKHFAAYLKPLFEFKFPSGGNDYADAYIQNLYAKVGFMNVELEVGRDNMVFGEGLFGGLSLSQNPRPFDLIKLSSPSPFYLPSFLKCLGLWKMSAFIANQWHQYNPRDSWISGYRVDNNMYDIFNMGFNQVIEVGGQGYKWPSVGENIIEMIGFPVADNPIDRLTSADAKISFKKLRGASLYGEFMIQNYELSKISWMVGASLPRLDYTGKWGGRIEYQNIGKQNYTHEQYFSGWTLNRLIMGDFGGPNSWRSTIYATYNFTPNSRLLLSSGILNRAFNSQEEYNFVNYYNLEFPYERLKLNVGMGWNYAVDQNFIDRNNNLDVIVDAGVKLELF